MTLKLAWFAAGMIVALWIAPYLLAATYLVGE